MAKKLGEMWNNLSDSEKQPYNNKAAKLKEKYEKVRWPGVFPAQSGASLAAWPAEQSAAQGLGGLWGVRLLCWAESLG